MLPALTGVTYRYPLGKQVRSDRRCAIQRHLLETETCDEEGRKDEVLSLVHVVDTEKNQCCRRSVINGNNFEATDQKRHTGETQRPKLYPLLMRINKLSRRPLGLPVRK